MGLLKKEIIDTTQKHYNLLHKNDGRSLAIVWSRQQFVDEKKWHKFKNSDPQNLEHFTGLSDVFITPNEFSPWLKLQYLRHLRACYVDIDRHPNDPLSSYELYDMIDNSGVPAPSFIIKSGYGWHLYWLIETTDKKRLPQWQQMQDILINKFNGDRAAKDATRFLRMAGTVHSKSGQVVTGRVFDEDPWVFDDLFYEVVGNPPTYRKPAKPAKVLDIQVAKAERKQRPKASHKSSIYSWWYLVYSDLVTIAEHHKDGIPEGYRNIFIHLLAVAMSWFASHHTIESSINDRASNWTAGLSDAEVSKAISSALKRLEQYEKGEKVIYKGKEVDPRYYYKRTTLFNILEPIISPELATSLRAIISNETRLERRKERAKEREKIRPKRDRVAEGRYKTKHTGIGKAKPWESEGISRATWYRRQAKK